MTRDADRRGAAPVTAATAMLDWLTARLSEQVHRVSSLTELQRDWLYLGPGPSTHRQHTDQTVTISTRFRLPFVPKKPLSLKFLLDPQKYCAVFCLLSVLLKKPACI